MSAWLPKVNLRRTFLIARRDYLGYVKTVGFWISFLMPFIGAGIAYAFTQLDVEVSPPRYEAILDETGLHKSGILALHEEKQKAIIDGLIIGLEGTMLKDEAAADIRAILEADGIEAAQAAIETRVPSLKGQLKPIENKLNFVDPPAENLEAIKPYLLGEKMIAANGKDRPLDGLIRISQSSEGPVINYWSKNINAYEAKSLAEEYFKALAETQYLSTGGLTREGFHKAQKGKMKVESFDPSKEGVDEEAQAVTKADRVPYFVAAVLSGFLWLTVFSGAYMLLTSMLEEKLNKLLEMMLASTRFSEIIFGKLLGVAALTLTAMAPYICIGVVGIIAVVTMQDSEIASALVESFTPKMIIFFIIFLVLGYIFYGACFIAMGALSQSMQDAQTITTPIVIVLTLCILVVPLGLNTPDSSLLRIASLFPLSAPFAVIIRLPSDPPLWELILSAVLLALLSIGVIWAAGRVFRYGVLSGSGVGAINSWFKRTILRKKA
jgi:ABC-2 type transport system permease protein